MNIFLSLLVMIFLFWLKPAVAADGLIEKCHGQLVNPITDVCWSCLLPISIGSIGIFHGDEPDTDNPSLPLCLCPALPLPRLGITVGFWEPIALVDVTRNPFCLVNLSGIKLYLGDFGDGEVDTVTPEQGGSFYYVHWYKYPLIAWLSIITDALCFEKADFDIAYLTELDPSWNNDEGGFLASPEAILFANDIAQIACAADSVAAFKGLPIDKLFWCAGSQGVMYPLNGFVQEHVGGVQASALMAERMAYKIHRTGILLKDSSADSICGEYYSVILPKSRYRYQMTNPIPASSEPIGCKPFGHTTADWGVNHEYPFSGEDFGYLIWRKRNCCVL